MSETRKLTYLYPELVVESVESLLALLNKYSEEKDRSSFQRVRILYLIKTKQVDCQKELAEIIGCHPTTVMNWIKRYRSKGLNGLLSRVRFAGQEAMSWKIDVSPNKIPKSLRPISLAQRLGVRKPRLTRNKEKRIFSRWTQQKDPDSVAWVWNPKNERYYSIPQNEKPSRLKP